MATLINGDAPSWLVFGLSGQVGAALQSALGADDPCVVAVSRTPQPAAPGVRWLTGSLDGFEHPALPVAAIASLGPLDAFVEWFEGSTLAPACVVALGSTSVHGKRGSPDPAERRLAETLLDCERRLALAAAARGSRLTVLRPTLIYGNGRDRNLSRLVALARRWRWLPLPSGPLGQRQPVHVDDVAAAVLRCLRDPAAGGGGFDLPGGETLPFDEMVRRTLGAGAPGARLVRIPAPLFRTGVRLLRACGRLDGAGEGVLARIERDLAYDGAPALKAVGHAPRGFQPLAAMFPD